MLQRFSTSLGNAHTEQTSDNIQPIQDTYSLTHSDTFPPSPPEPHRDLHYMNETDTGYEFNGDPFSNLILSVAVLLLLFRFLYELRQCVIQCGSYIHRKCHEKQRLLTMTVTDDDLDDLLLSDCSVCLEDFVIGDELMILPCHHNFHSTCAKEWLKHNHSCPLCRADIYEDVD